MKRMWIAEDLARLVLHALMEYKTRVKQESIAEVPALHAIYAITAYWMLAKSRLIAVVPPVRHALFPQ
jgi:hypothetical protein